MEINELKLYDDPGAAKETSIIDLGRIPVGTSTTIIKYLKNESIRWPIMNIQLNQTDPELDVEFPQMLKPGAVKAVKITFTPSIGRREPLNITQLFAGELYIG
ncbi:hypothetical protein [Nitrososphaeria virus YSH_462411]|uniref:Uncharacterized protein n=1 Tax=Nitrososphaeria virus YSH_462411 TaxID=3071321 RepID=A0A976UB44_9CAUD|nr:hypothetical protein QKV92_gp15 [Yangshan Harbor Nitrososphaeria virus]UVF62287.1 hypothetical protein [Nitrososphaeria virus YSH_462411]